MKRLPFLSLTGILLLGLAGCSGGSIALGIDGSSDRMDAVSAVVAPNSQGGHSIQITNYPVDMGDSYDYSKIRPTKAGQYRLDLNIIKARTSGKVPVSVGDYRPQPSNQTPKDKLVWARIMRFEDGREKRVVDLRGDAFQGSISILSADEETVTGRIDVSDGKSSIKGDFSAKLLQ